MKRNETRQNEIYSLYLSNYRGYSLISYSSTYYFNALLYSRAHTIVGVTFTQKYKNDAGQETAKKSLVNLVDLAGR